MELTKNHKSVLLARLEENFKNLTRLGESLRGAKSRFSKSEMTEDDWELHAMYEMDEYLVKEKIKLIQLALINNEIDY